MRPAQPTATEEGFDEAIVPNGHGGKMIMSREQFEQLPLSDRIRFIVEKLVEFRLRGRAVSSRAALRR